MKANGETGEPSAEPKVTSDDVEQATGKIQGLRLGDGSQQEDDGADKKDAENDELADIDLKDPELQKAALKIQSTFKGFKVRKHKQ